MRRALVWIRRDLRTRDQVAWARACAEAEEVAVVFVYDRVILDALPDRDDRRVSFIRRSVEEVDARLRECGSALITRFGDAVEIVPRLAHEIGAEAVFANGDVDPYALRRDAAVSRSLLSDGRRLRTFKDHVIWAPGEVLSPGGEPLARHRDWAEAAFTRLDPERDLAAHDPDLARLMSLDALRPHLREFSLDFRSNSLVIEPGERAAGQALDRFLTERLAEYADARHRPDLAGTSDLSAHLRHGTLSVREAMREGLARARPNRVRDPGEKWVRELGWRDYYHAILAHWPIVAEAAWDPAFREVAYPGTEAEFAAWVEGRTGYPIVDAAMRCLLATGTMPNRVRMIAASFLSRDLLTDFRRGEAHFGRYLLDYDLASNSGGWQWAASVGPDPLPWYSVMNPVEGARKFDPDGAFVRRWVPELAALDAASLHAPWESPLALAGYGIALGREYPAPIVDHPERRTRAIALLKEARRAYASGER